MATTNGSLTFAGFRPKKRRLPGRQAARGGRGDHRQGGARGVRDQRQLLQRPVGPGVERVQAVEVGDRLERRLGDARSRRTWPPARSARRPATRSTAPRRGASLVTLRGTDGLESGSGIMPLSWLTDFGGVMTRSVRDLADMLNVVTGTDPDDPTTAPADAERPADWRSVLDPNALRGQADRLHPRRCGTTRSAPPARPTPRRRRCKYLDRRGRDDRRDGRDRGRHQHAAGARRSTRPATRRRKAGCSTSTRIRSWPSRASRSATRST